MKIKEKIVSIVDTFLPLIIVAVIFSGIFGIYKWTKHFPTKNVELINGKMVYRQFGNFVWDYTEYKEEELNKITSCKIVNKSTLRNNLYNKYITIETKDGQILTLTTYESLWNSFNEGNIVNILYTRENYILDMKLGDK